MGKDKIAISHFKKVTKSNSDCQAVYYHLGYSLYRVKKISEAVEIFRKAVELNSEDQRSVQMLEFLTEIPGV